MIFLAQNDAESLNQYFEDFKEEIEYHDIDGKISVYAIELLFVNGLRNTEFLAKNWTLVQTKSTGLSNQ